MERFIPYEKLGKKERKKLDAEKRRGWNGLSPATKVVPGAKKVYRRKPKHAQNYDY